MKVRLGDVCEILNGFAFKSENYVSSGIRVIRISNVQKGYIEDLLPCFYPLEQKNRLSRYMLYDGDLLLSLTGNVGRVALLHKEMLPAVLNQRVACLRLKRKDVLLKYIFHYLNTDKFEQDCIADSKGIAQKNMSTEWLKEYVLEIPTLDIQQKGICILDRIDSLIEKLRLQLEKLDSLIKSQFIEMFGEYDLRNSQATWEKIETLAEVVGGSTPNTENHEFWGGGHFWITPAEISDYSYVINGTIRTLTDAGVKSCSLKLLPIGTVLLSSRAPIGKVAIAGVEMYCNQGFKNLICGKRLNSIYAYYLLKFNSSYLNSLGRGATFKEISKTIVGDIAIPVPPIKLQNEFAHFVEQTDESKIAVKCSLEKLETLKKSLMQKYFGGGVDDAKE